jgi:hypothetical protein
MPTGLAASLPWDALKHTEGDIPWDALNQFADALVAHPPLWEQLREVYDQFMQAPYEAASYECYYVPAIFALAAPRLDAATRGAIGRFLVDELVTAADEDDDGLIEVLEAAAGSMGPAVLQPVLEVIGQWRAYHDAWFHLWSLAQLAAGCPDEALRERVAKQCTRVLEDAERGRFTSTEAFGAAWPLVKMRRTDAIPLLRRVQERAPFPDLQGALDVLEGKAQDDTAPEMWEEPVQAWLQPRWQRLREWYEKGDEEDGEDSGESPGELIEEFMESPAAKALPLPLHVDAAVIVDWLLHYARDYRDASPRDLDEDVLEEVLLDLFPRKISAELETFEHVAPVLETFLRWLGSQGVLADGERLARVVGQWGRRIVANASDPANWGMAKGFVMQARSEGVNVEDPEELRRYMAVYNERIAGRRLWDGAEDDRGADDEPAAELPWPETIHVAPQVGRNDPCPCGSGKKFKKCCAKKGAGK